MVQKLTFFVAALASALVIAAGLAVAGLAPASPAAAPAAVSVAAPSDATATVDPAATPIVQVDTIYVAPQPTPQEIVVKEASVTHHDDDEGDEHEGEDD